jgi:hypothetical protein
VRLPRSSPRNALGSLKLLTAVDLAAPTGLQFVGRFLRPGAELDDADLPRPAVLLEDAGTLRTQPAHSRYSFDHLWILWRFDFMKGEWIEVVRGLARDASWTVDIAPIAHRLLHPPAGQVTSRSVEMRARPIVTELLSLIDGTLGEATREVQCVILAEIERHLGYRIAEAQKWRLVA